MIQTNPPWETSLGKQARSHIHFICMYILITRKKFFFNLHIAEFTFVLACQPHVLTKKVEVIWLICS